MCLLFSCVFHVQAAVSQNTPFPAVWMLYRMSIIIKVHYYFSVLFYLIFCFIGLGLVINFLNIILIQRYEAKRMSNYEKVTVGR